MIHSTILPLLVSVLGLVLGYLFTFLATEEIRSGEKYFQWLKKILLIVFLGVMMYGFFSVNKWILLIILTVVGLIILALHFTMHFTMHFTIKQTHPGSGRRAASTSLELATYALTYAFFVLGYLLLPSQQLLLASIIFLYGLPAGTMMGK